MTELFVDFETESEADLKKVGTWEYSGRFNIIKID